MRVFNTWKMDALQVMPCLPQNTGKNGAVLTRNISVDEIHLQGTRAAQRRAWVGSRARGITARGVHTGAPSASVAAAANGGHAPHMQTTAETKPGQQRHHHGTPHTPTLTTHLLAAEADFL